MCLTLLPTVEQWRDVFIPDGSTSGSIQWPLTATMLNVVAVHGGIANIAAWPSFDGNVLYTEVGKVDCYVIGMFK